MKNTKRLLKGAYTVWYRDVLSLVRDRARLFGSLAGNIIMLLGLGFGLGGAIGKIGGGAGISGIPYIEFAFPVVLCMTAMFTALQSTISIVWDREFGFLRKVLVAPVPRTSVALGKVLGGVTVAIIQATTIMMAAPFIGLRPSAITVAEMFLMIVLVSAVITALGFLVASRQKSMQGFQVISLFVLMPMTLSSFGSLLPSFGGSRVASLITTVSQINPVTYGIDALRQITLPEKLPASLILHSPGVDALILVGFFVVFLIPGVLLFSKQD